MNHVSLGFSDLRKKTLVFLPLVGLLLVAGQGSVVSTFSQREATRLLQSLPVFPGSVTTNKSYPHLLIMLPKEKLTTASSKYLMPATVSEIETWYLDHFRAKGWAETGSASSGNTGTGAVSSSEIEFTLPSYPLISYRLSIEPLQQGMTLAEVVVADAQTLRPYSSYLSTSFECAKVMMYSVATAVVRQQSTMYPFRLKKTSEKVVRSYVVNNAAVVHRWVKMLNAMQVSPKMGAADCPAIGSGTETVEVAFSSSAGPAKKMVTVPVGCRGLPEIGAVTLWDPTAKFWRTVTSYPQPKQPLPVTQS